MSPPAPENETSLEPMIDSPTDGETLGNARVGAADGVAVSVALSNVRLNRVTLTVTHPGAGSYAVPLSEAAPGGPWVGTVTFRHPGEAVLDATATGMRTLPPRNPITVHSLARVTVADTGPVSASIVRPANGESIPVPPGGKDVAVRVLTTASVIQRIECSVDGWATAVALSRVALEAGEAGDAWSAALRLPGTAPHAYALAVRIRDYFGRSSDAQSTFQAADTTSPLLRVDEPAEDAVLLAANPPLQLTARGNALDEQSGLQSLEWTLDGVTYHPLTVDGAGNWSVGLVLQGFGYYALRLRGTDRSGNVQVLDRQFELASAYTPRTIDELLSPRSYLQALLKFVRAHVLKADGSQMDTQALQSAFFQPFGQLAQPTTDVGSEVRNSLHVPIEVLRAYLAAFRGPVAAEWNFDEASGTAVVDAGPWGNNGSMQGRAQWGQGATAGGLSFDGSTGMAEIPHSGSLFLGAEDRDFAVSFWIYLRTGATGAWRAIMHKGSSDSQRTFSLWMHPEDDRVHFRISTSAGPNEGGDSVSSLSLHRWTHVAYVKAGRSLKLYLDGRLDAVVSLQGASVANAGPVYLGRSPWYAGIDGALDDVRAFAFALPAGAVESLAQDRNASSRRTSASAALRAYLQAAYEALLSGLGTSYAEMRQLATLSAEQRQALAARLGLRSAPPAGDHLGDLLPPQAGLGEAWLEDVFGLPSTSRDPFQAPGTVPPALLQWQRQALLASWSAEDVGGGGDEPAPYLDPDIADAQDLSSSDRADPLASLLATRAAWLDGQRQAIRAAATAGGVAAAVHGVLGAAVNLEQLAQRESTGETIAADLAALHLAPAGFRRLLTLQRLGQVAALTNAEWDDVADILTGARKAQQRPTWRAEETALPLWPAGFRVDHHPRSFPAWRATYADRYEWQARVGGRLSRWSGLERALREAAADAAQAALPTLRDGLVGGRFGDEVAPAIADLLAERLLVDLASAGATRASRIDQAVLSLQGLVNGLRTGRFGPDHPAATWTIPERAARPDDFEEEWGWMGSYGRWRAATSVFLYPENSLLPGIIPGPTAAYAALAKGLRSSARLTGDRASELFAAARAGGMSSDEESYFAIMLVGTELQKARLHGTALDWYRKAYDPGKRPGERALAPLLRNERNIAPDPQQDDHWTRTSLDPHVNARGRHWGNPYTRYTLSTVASALLAYADSEYAGGTLDALSSALGLYLTAGELLDSPELDLVPPTAPTQIFIPNPLLDAQRAHVASALRKLRRGLGFSGLPIPADPTRSPAGEGGAAAMLETSTRPTPYRFKVLLERARGLAAQAQQFEAQYLAALEKQDVEAEKVLREGANLAVGQAAVELQRRRQKEASDGTELARRQRARAAIAADRHEAWIAAGPSALEDQQLAAIGDAKQMRDLVAVADAAAATASAIEGISAPWQGWAAAGVAVAAAGRAVAQGFLNDAEARSQTSAILASQERRQQEWVLQRDLERQDELVGDQQIALASDHEAIAEQELAIATVQAQGAQTMVEFLSAKFTSREFYSWLAGELSSTYAYFLQVAASVAKLAERQLAFERQDRAPSLVAADYWKDAPQGQAADPGSPDRRGMAGSARLLRDITALDQAAFESDRRRLNLSHTILLARASPLEFQQFKTTGVLPFATPSRLFDEVFPGHYLRQVKRVRVSVVALIPPSIGIRATLSSSGISRVLAGPPTFGTVIVRQDPESVALTASANATGVFELDAQSELLLPFEGMGVDATWIFELPPRANPFDFDSIAEVLVTLDYTALSSPELRDRVAGRMSPEAGGDIAWSVRRDLPDVWYDLNNPSGPPGPAQVAIPVSRSDYPPHLCDLATAELLVAVRPAEPSTEVAGQVTPSFRNDQGQVRSGTAAPLQRNVASTRRAAGAAWAPLRGAATALGTWTITLEDPGAPAGSGLATMLRAGEIDDILVVLTFAARRPDW